MKFSENLTLQRLLLQLNSSFVKMAWRGDKIVRAEIYERPKLGGGGPCTHSGVVVHTEKGQSFLIHNTPESGVVATPAENMSRNWQKTQDIEVKGHKTVGDALRGGYTPGSSKLDKAIGGAIRWIDELIEYIRSGSKGTAEGGYTKKYGEYAGSGTCKGTAYFATNELQK